MTFITPEPQIALKRVEARPVGCEAVNKNQGSQIAPSQRFVPRLQVSEREESAVNQVGRTFAEKTAAYFFSVIFVVQDAPPGSTVRFLTVSDKKILLIKTT